jgi:hypothetical protein
VKEHDAADWHTEPRNAGNEAQKVVKESIMSDLPSRTLLFACLSLALAGAHGCSGKTLAIGGDAGAAGHGTSNDAGRANSEAAGGTGPGAAGRENDAELGGTGPASAGRANGGASGGTYAGGAGSPGQCADQELAMRGFLDANKTCTGDSDCQQALVGCGVTEDDCTGAVYVNKSTDTSELEQLRRALSLCASGGVSDQGCGACFRAIAASACILGRCENSRVAAALEPVRVIRGEPGEPHWDLTIRGEDLEEYEGKRVRVRIGSPDRPPERLGSGGTLIKSGTFGLFFPEVWETSLYKLKLVFIDVDGNGSCDPAQDRVYRDARAAYATELVMREPLASGQFELHESSYPEIDCAVFNSPWPEK